ncbi:MAG: hypothetical protein K2O59_04570 [Lachnospiraceae bacterium]|nr:hypothetical protein [Lachnospiraceae bacterium]
MDIIEIAKATLHEMTGTAEKVTEGEVIAEIGKRGCHFGYYETIEALKSVYKEMGLERTEPHTGRIICYYKPKKEPKQQETAATMMAKKAAQSNVNERKTAAIIGNYRR